MSSAALAVAGVARQRNKVAIFNAGSSDFLQGVRPQPRRIGCSTPIASPIRHQPRQTAEGGDTWYFVQANYSFGASLAADLSTIIEAQGGKVLGVVKYPFPETSDFSSPLQVQASGAKALGLASAGADTGNLVKQAKEFGLTQGGKMGIRRPALSHSAGACARSRGGAEGCFFRKPSTGMFNDATCSFCARYSAPQVDGAMPGTIQVGCYRGACSIT